MHVGSPMNHAGISGAAVGSGLVPRPRARNPPKV